MKIEIAKPKPKAIKELRAGQTFKFCGDYFIVGKVAKGLDVSAPSPDVQSFVLNLETGEIHIFGHLVTVDLVEAKLTVES